MVNNNISVPAMLMATIVFTLTMALPTHTHAGLLSKYEWSHRPLLIFARNTDDPQYKRTLELVDSIQCELEDRHMVIGRILSNGTASLGDIKLTGQQADELRQQFRVKEDHFTVLLIGKDGGEKYRTDSVPDMRQVFSLIDGMPMRQQEMQLQFTRC